jgi:hypothetical protein
MTDACAVVVSGVPQTDSEKALSQMRELFKSQIRKQIERLAGELPV